MQKSKALLPVQEKAQYSNTAFWTLDYSKDTAKKIN